VLRSVGYKGVPLPASRSTSGAARSRTTAAASRAQSGVIGTNKKDATETIELLLEDARAGKLDQGQDALDIRLRVGEGRSA
jgi:ferredoxin/flavodoxin---NADP+ reductase